MQATSALYKSILSGEHRVEYGITFGELTDGLLTDENGNILIFGDTAIIVAPASEMEPDYKENYLYSLKTSRQLFDGSPAIGKAVAGEVDIEILNPTIDIPRAEKIQAFCRICNETQKSEWIRKGVHYIDTRELDKATGKLKIHGYDAMLKTEQIYATEQTVWTDKLISVAIAEISARMGVSVKGGSAFLNSLPTFKVQYDNTLTMRQYLQNIGAMLGGSWIISDVDELAFVPMFARSSEQNIGLSMFDLSTDGARAFDGVELELSSGSYVRYPTNAEGNIIRASCEWATQDLGGVNPARYAFQTFGNNFYRPYYAKSCVTLDPALENGDGVMIDGNLCTIYNISTIFGTMLSCDISAPFEEDIDHEYPYISSAAKTTERRLATARAELRVLGDRIESVVSSVSTTYSQDTVPTKPHSGDLWYVTGEYDLSVCSNSIGGSMVCRHYMHGKWYRYNGAEWELTTDIGIAEAMSQITQTARKILMQVAESSQTWDETEHSIQFYGYGAPGNITGAVDGNKYLDQSTGYVYTYNSGVWEKTAELEAKWYQVQSGIDITADGIDISGAKHVNIKSGGTFTTQSGNFNIDENGNVSIGGNVTVSGNLSAPNLSANIGGISFGGGGYLSGLGFSLNGEQVTNWGQLRTAVFG